jgi:cyclophilin family peptidyl-prolyl cis-trans isomerase
MKAIKKVMCTALAGVSVFACGATFAGCTTSHPKVEMKISFNDVTYTLEYKLYRKIAPATTQHFLELVEKGYYDGMCVHNYTASRWYTGGYYDEEYYKANANTDALKNVLVEETVGGLIERRYFDSVAAWSLTQTVWTTSKRETGLNTVYGEFSNNGFEVTNGALKQTYGSLTMYYTAKTADNTDVCVQRADGSGYDYKRYEYNSATSLFYISTSTSTSTNTSYCTFAQLADDDSEDVLDSLLDAIDAYIDSEYSEDESEFLEDVTLLLDADDPYVADDKEKGTYSVPKKPIIIQSVTVKSY